MQYAACGSGRALQLFSQNTLKHRLVQRQLCHQLHQSRVLVSKLLRLSNLIHFQAGILGLPAVKRLLADSRLSDHLGDRNTYLGLLQYPIICSTLNRFFFMANPPPSQARFCRKTNISSGSEITGPILSKRVGFGIEFGHVRTGRVSDPRYPACTNATPDRRIWSSDSPQRNGRQDLSCRPCCSAISIDSTSLSSLPEPVAE